MKIVNEFIIPDVNGERSNLKLPKEQKVLMVMDVFTGQMTNAVLKQSQDNNIFIINVARNMTKCHQPLDITVNEYYK